MVRTELDSAWTLAHGKSCRDLASRAVDHGYLAGTLIGNEDFVIGEGRGHGQVSRKEESKNGRRHDGGRIEETVSDSTVHPPMYSDYHRKAEALFTRQKSYTKPFGGY